MTTDTRVTQTSDCDILPNTIFLHRSDDYGKNADRSKGDDYPCAVCGRVCKSPVWRVVLTQGGHIIATRGSEADDPSDPGYLGYYPIGSACLRDHPEYQRFAFHYEGDAK